MEWKLEEFNGEQLAFYEQGEGDTCLFFIHGNSLSCEMFEKQFTAFSLKGYACAGIDLPGHGNSPKAADPANTYTYNSLSALVKSVVRSLDSKKIILVGHSLGGHLAMDAIGCSDAIKGIAIFGSPPLESVASMAVAFKLSPEFQLAFKEELSQEEAELLAKAFLASGSNLVGQLAEYVLKSDSDFRKYYAVSLPVATIKNQKEQLALVPKVCLMQGEEERMVSLEYLQTKAGELQTSVHIIDKAAHCLQIENADAFNAVLSGYLELI